MALIHSRVKPKTYQIDTCRHLAWHSALIGSGKDQFAQYQDNVTEWDIISCDVLFQVMSLPSQTCAYKVKITETSLVANAEIVSIKGKKIA